jgi:hypothetical protein
MSQPVFVYLVFFKNAQSWQQKIYQHTTAAQSHRPTK